MKEIRNISLPCVPLERSNMYNKTRKMLVFLCIIAILGIHLTGCSKNDENKILKDKINSEIAYLDTKLVDMLNDINGISIQNYIVKAEQVNDNEGSSNTKSDNSSSKSNEQSSKSGEGSRAEVVLMEIQKEQIQKMVEVVLVQVI